MNINQSKQTTIMEKRCELTKDSPIREVYKYFNVPSKVRKVIDWLNVETAGDLLGITEKMVMGINGYGRATWRKIEDLQYDLEDLLFAPVPAETQMDDGKTIDWEQRRYELAKAAMNGLLSCQDCSMEYEEIAENCVMVADALINELLKRGEDAKS